MIIVALLLTLLAFADSGPKTSPFGLSLSKWIPWSKNWIRIISVTLLFCVICGVLGGREERVCLDTLTTARALQQAGDGDAVRAFTAAAAACKGTRHAEEAKGAEPAGSGER